MPDKASINSRYSNYDNVYDYTAYKLYDIANLYAGNDRDDLADIVLNVIDQYMSGTIVVTFDEGDTIHFVPHDE